MFATCGLISVKFSKHSIPDNAYACDPRIKKFKDDEKEKKVAEKRAKEAAAKAAADEKERVSMC